MERDAYMVGLNNLQLQLEKVQKELSPTIIEKINNVVANMKDVSEMIIGIKTISEIISDHIPP